MQHPPLIFRATSLDFLKLLRGISGQGPRLPLVAGEEAWDGVRRGGGVGEKLERCAPDRKSGRRWWEERRRP